jgi:hypothetical protein
MYLHTNSHWLLRFISYHHQAAGYDGFSTGRRLPLIILYVLFPCQKFLVFPRPFIAHYFRPLQSVALTSFRLTRAHSLSLSFSLYGLNFSSYKSHNHANHDLVFWRDTLEYTFLPLAVELIKYSLKIIVWIRYDIQNVGWVVHKRTKMNCNCFWHPSTLKGQQITIYSLCRSACKQPAFKRAIQMKTRKNIESAVVHKYE